MGGVGEIGGVSAPRVGHEYAAEFFERGAQFCGFGGEVHLFLIVGQMHRWLRARNPPDVID